MKTSMKVNLGKSSILSTSAILIFPSNFNLFANVRQFIKYL